MMNDLENTKQLFYQSSNNVLNELKKELPIDFNISLIEKQIILIHKRKKAIETFRDSYITQSYKDFINNYMSDMISYISNIKNKENIFIYVDTIKNELDEEYYELCKSGNDQYL